MRTDTISHDTRERLVVKFGDTNHLIEITIQEINNTESRIAQLADDILDRVGRVKGALFGGMGLTVHERFDRSATEIDQLMIAREIHWRTLGRLVGDDVITQIAKGEF